MRTDRWAGLDGYPGGISLVAGEGPDLLLKHNNAEIVYAYRLGDQMLRDVSVDRWNTATDDVVDCNEQVVKAPSNTRIDKDTHQLFIGSREVEGIAGEVHLEYRFTSTGDKLAVLSAAGKKTLSLSPFLGEGGASGTHYTQVLRYPGLAPIGSPVKLPFTTEAVTFQGCWSADERFLIYSDAIHSQLAIVTVR